MVDAEALARLLHGSVLAGRPVETLELDRLLVRIAPDEVWPAWHAARAVVDASGRWPVAIASWGDDELGGQLLGAAWAGVMDEPGDGIDPWAAYADSWRDFALDDGWVDALVRGWGLSEAEAQGYVARGERLEDVEWARLQRRLEGAAGAAERLEVSEYLTDRDKLWFEPAGQPTGIAFLTTSDPVQAVAHLHWYAWGGPELVAVAREWHERYGAELVAGWLTMMQFVARRRPATVEEAWELAGQQLRVGGSLQVDRDELALALMRTPYWFLHERP